MAGCFGTSLIDRFLEKQVDDYYDRLDQEEENSETEEEEDYGR